MSSGMLADLKLIQAVQRLVGSVKVRPAPAPPPAPPGQPKGASGTTGG